MEDQLHDPMSEELLRGWVEMCGWTLTERALAVPILEVAKRAAMNIALEELKTGSGKIIAIARGRDCMMLAVNQLHTVINAMRHFTSEIQVGIIKELVRMDPRTGIIQMLSNIVRELSDSLRENEPGSASDVLCAKMREHLATTIRARIADLNSVSTPEQQAVIAPILAGAEDAILAEFDAHGPVMCAHCSIALYVRMFAKYTAACEEAVKAVAQ